MLGFSTEITDIKENQEFTEEKPIFLQEAMIIKQKFFIIYCRNVLNRATYNSTQCYNILHIL